MANSLNVVIVFAAGGRVEVCVCVCVCVCFPFFAANTTLFTIYYYLLFTISVFMCIINFLGLDSSFSFFSF